MVPDPELTSDENKKATKGLSKISKALHKALPDPSLSPAERLERLARVVQDRVPLHEHLLPAATKLFSLKNRLDQLVPGSRLTSEEKIAKLTSLAKKKIPQHGLTMAKRLEMLGDKRAGFSPIQ